MTAEKNNPVSRLHQILIAIGEYAQQTEKLKIPLAEIMKYPQGDMGYAKAIKSFLSLINEVERSIRTSQRIGDPGESLIIVEDFNIYLVSSNLWEVQVKTINNWVSSKYILNHLRMLASNISQEYVKTVFTENCLIQLIDKFNSIKEEIIASTLSVELKRFLLKKVNEILLSIENYSLSGPDGIKAIADGFIGEITIQSQSGYVTVSDKRDPLFSRVLSRFGAIALLLQINAIYIEPTMSTIVSSTEITERFLQPDIEDFEQVSSLIEVALSEKDSFEEAIEEVVGKVKKDKSLYLEGKETKYLPGSSFEEE